MSRVFPLPLRRAGLLVLSALVTAGLLVTGITPAAHAAPGDATLEVRVTTHAGLPYAALAVTAFPLATGAQAASPGISGTPVAGKPGRFTFVLDGGARYTIGATTRAAGVGGAPVVQYYGGATTPEAGRPVTVATGSTTLEFSLFAGSLSGKVLTSAGKALANVDVTVYRVQGSTFSAVDTVATTAKGAWAFTSLEPGTYTVRYATARAARAWIAANAGGGPVLSDTAYGTTYSVAFGKPIVLSQRLKAGGTITGVVRGSGLPLAGATVQAASLTGKPGAFTGGGIYTPHTVVANAAGTFSIPGLASGYYALSIRPTGSQEFADPFVALATAKTVKVVAGKSVAAPASMTAATPGTATLTGAITGGPATLGGTVSVGRVGDFDRTERVIPIQANGSYSVVVPPGQYQLRIRPINTANASQKAVVVYRSRTVSPLPATTAPVTSAWDLDPGLTFATGPLISNAATTVVGTTHSIAATSLRLSTSTLTVQWYRDGMPIFGATGTTYLSRGSDVGASLVARVTLTDTVDNLGRIVANTAPIVVTAGATVTNTGAPTVTPVAATYLPGTKVVATAGFWSHSPVTVVYQWTRDGADIPGATSAAYTLAPADGGSSVAVRVQARKAGHGASALITTTPISVGRFAAPVLKKAPTVTSSTAGQVAGATRYTVGTGTWAPVPGYAYQWLRDGQPIAGATGASFVHNPAQLGTAALAVRVDAVRTGYVTGSTVVVARRGSAVPAGTGTPAVTAGGSTVSAAQNVPLSTVLTATPGSWTTPDASAPPTFTYAWQRQLAAGAWAAIPGATKVTYPVALADVGRPLRVLVTVVSPRYSNVVLPPIAAGVGYLRQDLATAPTTVTVGGAGVPTVASSAAGIVWPVASVTQTYQWFSCVAACASYPTNYTAVAKATAASYLPPASFGGRTLVVRVVGSKAGFAPRALVSAPRTLGAYGVLTSTAPPAYAKGLVSGSAKVRVALTPSAAGWNIPGVTRSYEWQKCSTACSTETNWSTIASGASYVPDVAAFGTGANKLRVVEIARKPGYTAARAEATVQLAILPSLEYPTSTPVVTRSGDTLTVSPVSWLPASPTNRLVQYAWHVGDSWVGVDSRSYTIKPADAGKPIWVQISYDSGIPAYSNYAGIIEKVAIRGTAGAQTPPVFTGSRVGDYLYFQEPSFSLPASGGDTYQRTYQWLSNGVAIKGQTDFNYLATADQLGKEIRLRATLVTDRYNPVVATSAPVVIQPGETSYGSVSLNGSGYIGSVLTATPYFPAGHTLAYQWIRDTDGVKSVIPKATAKTYTVTAADRYTAISVRVTAKRAGYTTRVAESYTVYAGDRYLSASSQAAIVGSSAAGSVLSVIPGTYIGVKPAFTYQWMRNGSAIAGATAAAYTTAAGNVGEAISVQVTAKLAGYSSSTQGTDPRIITVGAAPTALGVNAPKVTGLAQGCATLTATRGTWTADGAGYAYQWHSTVDGPIPGATDNQFTIPSGAYTGQKLFVVVTATRTGLAVGTAQSVPTSAVLATGC